MTTTKKSIYSEMTSDERVALLISADKLGCKTVTWYHGEGYCFKVPKSTSDNIFAVCEALEALMTANGFKEVAAHKSVRHRTDDPKTCWHGDYNLPPEEPKYSLFVTYELT